jgi:competence protein ComEC
MSGSLESEILSSYDSWPARRRLASASGLVIAVWVTIIMTAAISRSVGLTLVHLGLAAGVLSVHRNADPVEAHRLSPILWALGLAAALGFFTLWRASAPVDLPQFGLHQGWAQVVTEPRPQARGVRVVLRIDGQRFESFVQDADLLEEVRRWQGGHQVRLLGEKRSLSSHRASRVAWQHVVGSYRIDAIRDRRDGSRLSVFSNGLRASISRGAHVLPPTDAALFQGLVIGDRSGQTHEMQQRYAASGLSHLTVVSGLNVSLLMVAIAPILRRARPVLRWLATLVILAWFVSLTRYEPSILRAATMAALVATASLRGDDRRTWRILWIAVGLLLLHDPALVHSVGFWLSVGATAGVAVLGPQLAAGLRGLGPLATPLGISLGAQIGVAPPMLLLMGGIPLWSVPANLVAVPVASLVKLYGLPAAALAGAVPALAPLLMFPTRVAVRWVDLVAVVASSVHVGPTVTRGVWILWIAISVWALRPRPDKNRERHDSASTQR